MKKYILILIAILAAFMLCGTASATSSNISLDGKNISVTYKYVNSTLKDSYSVTQKNGTYGYGYYLTIKTTGHDIKGTNNNRTAIYFNKYSNQFTGNDFKSGIVKKNNSDGSWSIDNIKVVSNSLMTETMTGRTFTGLTYSGNANYTLYFANGERLTKNITMRAKFYKNGIYYATITSIIIPTYQLIAGSYQVIKQNMTSKTTYANNDTRKSIIITTYKRDSTGKLIGMGTSGTSSGTETINGKTVTYTGKITVQTKYDPKDTWNENYTTGNYTEIRTSTSSTLVRRTPIEAL